MLKKTPFTMDGYCELHKPHIFLFEQSTVSPIIPVECVKLKRARSFPMRLSKRSAVTIDYLK